MGSSRRAATTGDVRLDRRGEWMLERIVASGSLQLREIGGARKGEVAAHRYLSSDKISFETILAPHVARTRQAVMGRRVLAVQDTTEVNFSGRDRGRSGLGPAGDGVAKGFFIHPVVAVDADSEVLLGVAGAKIWTRGNAATPDHKRRGFADKESLRWLQGAECAATLGPEAATVTMVADRESDVYPLFARRPAGVELVVRAGKDRALAGGGRLFAAPESWPELGRVKVRVAPRGPGDKGRTAMVALQAGTVTIRKPANGGERQDPAMLTLNLVQAREVDASPGVKAPLLWHLVTTLPAATLAEAAEAVRLYRLRWRIEEVFRALKSDGLRLQDSQVESAVRLFNLAALGLLAAVSILQLVDARDGSERPATDVIAAEQIDAAAAIGTRLEGATERQKNPHAKGSLPWLAWIVARLGGWNCYYKPPGPKTMARGLDRLAGRLEGFRIAHDAQHV
jgi:Transposase DDE domain